MKKLIYLLLILTTSANAEITKIYSNASRSDVTYEQFLEQIPGSGFVVMGEMHNTPSIQNAQSKMIQDLVITKMRSTDFTVMWEFLNFTDAQKTDLEYNKFVNNEITATEFISNTAGKNNLTYAPIFETAKSLKAQVFGLNAPRSIKSQMIKGGLSSIDQKMIPPNMEVGGEAYKKRFYEVMSGHVPAEKLERYFLAQCYTDSVMSYQASISGFRNLNFIIAGSFHTDYYDGTVSRLKLLRPDSITTLTIRNVSSMTSDDIAKLLSPSGKNGPVADFVILTK